MRPNDALSRALVDARSLEHPPDAIPARIWEMLSYVVTCQTNRAGVRLLMACLLAKIENPHVDARKPYTEIGGPDCFSGRTYDEKYITNFISQNRLPCNPTTAFLTPALRNINAPLNADVQIEGRPKTMYAYALELLDHIENEVVAPWDILVESVRLLLILRDERAARLMSLIDELADGAGAIPLSSEGIVTLIEQHLRCRGASRLPVLVVAAAYEAAMLRVGERARPLERHNAADLQTGACGDVEVCLENDERIVTVYEMKQKSVTVGDIDVALAKLDRQGRVDNYIFITTEPVDREVADYAASLYDVTRGVEFAILDCVNFLRHFLHLFHRLRADFLNAYQRLLLDEPDSAVGQPLKEAFLALRHAAEAEL